MIPVGPGEIPISGTELASRISATLGQIITAGARPQVSCEMAGPADITSLTLDVTGAECGNARVERPSGFTRLGMVNVGDFQIHGSPGLVFGAPVDIKTRAANLPMSWSRDDRGSLWLVPHQSEDSDVRTEGDLEISAGIAQVEKAARAAIETVAQQNGAKLKDFKLRLESAGPRAMAARVDIAASKFMMTAKLFIIADVTLDENMNLHIGQLECRGEGAAGGMVANMLGDKLRDFQGKQIDLGQFMFAGAALKDVQLIVDDKLRLSAQFG